MTDLTKTTTRKIGFGSLHQRLNVAAKQDASPETCDHRIALMLDTSGSMSGAKIESLREATIRFLQNCDLTTTALALETFGRGGNQHLTQLTRNQAVLFMMLMGLDCDDGTPMTQSLDYVLRTYPITRGILVSDGEPDNSQTALDQAGRYREASVEVDCVHIGTNTSGEQFMRDFAERTGGMFIKFTDVASFSKSFKFLTPMHRGTLAAASTSERRLMLGAAEVR